MTITGTAGNNNLHGTTGDDDFDVSQGGNDTVRGRAGNDTIDFGNTFDANDHVFGGNGFDTLKLSGGHDIHQLVALDSVEKIVIADGFGYGFQFASATIAAGHTLTFDASALSAGHTLDLEDQSEDGRFVITGGDGLNIIFTGNGNDVIHGGASGDVINPGSGTDIVFGGGGVDTIQFTAAGGKLDPNDRIDGGDPGANILNLAGDYSAGLVFNAHTIKNITTIHLGSGFDYSLTLGDATLLDNFTFVVDGSELGASDTMHIDGSAQRHYHGYSFVGGAGDDVFIGASGDYFTGGLGADQMTAGGGADVFVHNAVAESTSVGYDTITGFDARADFFDLGFTVDPGTIGGFDGKISHGKLSTGHFDTNLENAVGPGRLAIDHAVLYQPDSGTLAGSLFLIVDGNGEAGYQAGEDLVVRLDGALHMANFDAGNFGTPG